MIPATDTLLAIPYGLASWPSDSRAARGIALDTTEIDGFGPVAVIDPKARQPLRLNTLRYVFAEAPDPLRLATLGDRLAFLRGHLQSLCGTWDKLPRLFLDAYFRFVAASLEGSPPALDAAIARHGGIFERGDWTYSALAPLPRAQLHAPEEASGQEAWVGVDIAFWTGTEIAAVDLIGPGTRQQARRTALERLRRQGVVLIEISGTELERDGERALTALLPREFREFWRSQPIPASPFSTGSLDGIPPAQSSSART
ncbi:MAG: hypothetical protein ACM3O6_09235 [Acidobacteriota bacterium]